jgi:predicted GNAT family acetyltransferase
MQIEHESSNRRFVARLEEGRALLDYEILEDGAWDLTLTYVPEQQRGRGVATRLVLHVLERAAEEDRRIVPSCPFVADVIRKHPEWGRLVRLSGAS